MAVLSCVMSGWVRLGGVGLGRDWFGLVGVELC